MTTLPHSIEAEESVIGGILVNRKAFNEVADILQPEEFYHPALKAIYEAMIALDANGKPIDALTVLEQMRALETVDNLRASNGPEYLNELTAKVITTENLGFHASIVRGKATARRLVETCQDIAAKGRGEYGDVDEYLDESEAALFAACQRRDEGGDEEVRKILQRNIQALEKRYDDKKAITGVPTDFAHIDAMTAGLQPGDLVIVAGRPSMGKTAWALNASENAACDHGVPVLVFSLEMSKESLVNRMLCSSGRVDSTKMRGGFLETRDWAQISRSAARIAAAPIRIDDTSSPTLMEIRTRARKWRAKHTDPKKLAMVVVDYLQLISPPPSKYERNEVREIADITRGLKGLAKELECPVMCLSQLNRELEKRQDKRPQMSDLRQSGAIEQDADVIAFLYRDEVYTKDDCAEEDKGIAEVIVAKQRNGPTGTVRLAFLNNYTRFENLRGVGP